VGRRDLGVFPPHLGRETAPSIVSIWFVCVALRLRVDRMSRDFRYKKSQTTRVFGSAVVPQRNTCSMVLVFMLVFFVDGLRVLDGVWCLWHPDSSVPLGYCPWASVSYLWFLNPSCRRSAPFCSGGGTVHIGGGMCESACDVVGTRGARAISECCGLAIFEYEVCCLRDSHSLCSGHLRRWFVILTRLWGALQLSLCSGASRRVEKRRRRPADAPYPTWGSSR